MSSEGDTYHGWWNSRAAEEHGYYEYAGAGGEIVKVTIVSHSPLHGYPEGTVYEKDQEYVGIVDRFIRSVDEVRPQKNISE